MAFLKILSRIFIVLRNWLADASRLLFPNVCVVCGNRLVGSESVLCTSCFVSLPFTKLQGKPGNVVERMFWGKIPIERATAWLCYHGGAESTRVITEFKYKNRPQYGALLGELMAYDLMDTDFFETIDLIIPVPLSKKKERSRGFNQSRELSKGISQVCGIPVVDGVIERVVSNPTQTRLSTEERKRNVEGIFRLMNPAMIANKHVLLVDDVLTSGSTLTSCAQELCKAENVRISVMSLFVANKIVGINPPK